MGHAQGSRRKRFLRLEATLLRLPSNGEGKPANRGPKDRPASTRDDGIAYPARAARQQSTRSTQPLRAMPETGGRSAGEGGQNPKGAVEAANRKGISPIPVEPHPRRAVCAERCPHGSGGGSWKRADFGRVGKSQRSRDL